MENYKQKGSWADRATALFVMFAALVANPSDAALAYVSRRQALREGRRGASGTSQTFHLVAILLGIVGAVFVVLAILLAYGYTTPSAIGGITLATSELYATLAIVGAIGCEVGAREWK